MSSLSKPLRSTAPHPDHFDPTKFGPDGERIRTSRRLRGAVGVKSPLRPEDVEPVLRLMAAGVEKDLVEFLQARGINTRAARGQILRKLRTGWRPKR